MRTTTLWNDGWLFYEDPSCGEALGDFPWQPVTLPHDWQIWHAKDLYRDGTGWYQKHFSWMKAFFYHNLLRGNIKHSHL